MIHIQAGGVTAEAGAQKATRPVTVSLTGASGAFTMEWMELKTGSLKRADILIGGSERLLTCPFQTVHRT